MDWQKLEAPEREGRTARCAGKPRTANPYLCEPSDPIADDENFGFRRMALAWYRGWDAQSAALQDNGKKYVRPYNRK